MRKNLKNLLEKEMEVVILETKINFLAKNFNLMKPKEVKEFITDISQHHSFNNKYRILLTGKLEKYFNMDLLKNYYEFMDLNVVLQMFKLDDELFKVIEQTKLVEEPYKKITTNRDSVFSSEFLDKNRKKMDIKNFLHFNKNIPEKYLLEFKDHIYWYSYLTDGGTVTENVVIEVLIPKGIILGIIRKTKNPWFKKGERSNKLNLILSLNNICVDRENGETKKNY
jgi:hypothetical protein